MDIGIIGAGHIGSALARHFTTAGHNVSIANSRGPETLADLAAETGARAVTAEEAARAGDVVVVTVPQKAVPNLPREILAASHAVVIDTGNYYPSRDGRIEPIEAGTPDSEWVAATLGHPVVKAFNNIQALHLQDHGSPAGTPHRVALPVAGDDATAKATVLALIDAIGFDAVDAGGLDESWRQQPGSPVYGTDLDADGVRAALLAASPDRAPEWSDAGA